MLQTRFFDRVIVVAVVSMLFLVSASWSAPAVGDRSSSASSSPPQLVAQAQPAPAPVPMRAREKGAPLLAKRMPESPIEGVFSVDGGTQVIVRRISGDLYRLLCPDGWEGVGILEGKTYLGVFHSRGSRDLPDGSLGYHTIDWTDLDHPSVQIDYANVQRDRLVQKWHRAAGESRGSEAPIDLAKPHRPEFGEYVYVEELPEAITKVAPAYPDLARKDGVEGTVMIQALVLEDGTVGDCRIVKSIPLLDEAAIAAVRQWRFKPALNKGNPVAVWVAVPVSFKTH